MLDLLENFAGEDSLLIAELKKYIEKNYFQEHEEEITHLNETVIEDEEITSSNEPITEDIINKLNEPAATKNKKKSNKKDKDLNICRDINVPITLKYRLENFKKLNENIISDVSNSCKDIFSTASSAGSSNAKGGGALSLDKPSTERKTNFLEYISFILTYIFVMYIVLCALFCVLNSDINRDTPLSVFWVGYGYGPEVCMIALCLAKLGIKVHFNCIDIDVSYEKEGKRRWKKIQKFMTDDEKGKFWLLSDFNMIDTLNVKII
jgi:hypothetical protein